MAAAPPLSGTAARTQLVGTANCVVRGKATSTTPPPTGVLSKSGPREARAVKHAHPLSSAAKHLPSNFGQLDLERQVHDQLRTLLVAKEMALGAVAQL